MAFATKTFLKLDLIFSFSVVDTEADIPDTTGVTYNMLQNACVALIKPNTNNGGGRRTPRQLIVNRGQIGRATVGFDLATFSLLSAGAKGNHSTLALFILF